MLGKRGWVAPLVVPPQLQRTVAAPPVEDNAAPDGCKPCGHYECACGSRPATIDCEYEEQDLLPGWRYDEITMAWSRGELAVITQTSQGYAAFACAAPNHDAVLPLQPDILSAQRAVEHWLAEHNADLPEGWMALATSTVAEDFKFAFCGELSVERSRRIGRAGIERGYSAFNADGLIGKRGAHATRIEAIAAAKASV